MMRGRYTEIGILLDPYLEIRGEIKKKPEDFIVEEIFRGKTLKIRYNILEKIEDTIKLRFSKKKRYFHFTLVKRNISTLDFVHLLKRKGIRKVYYTGIKDKRAVTSQRMCIMTKDLEKLPFIGRDFYIKNFSFENWRIRLGMHDGNRFKILVRDIKRFYDFSEIVKKGIPNFYGPQRFGIKRPNNHKIGKMIIKGRFEEACYEILAKEYFEGDEEREIRKEIRENWREWDHIYRILKGRRFLWVERELAKNLKRYKDPEKALMKLPRYLLRMWIDAYQSYLFNLTLSEVEKRKISVEKIPLVAHYLRLDKIGEVGEIIREILEKEEIKLGDFRIRKKIRPRVKYRNRRFFPKNLRWKLYNKDLFLEFILGKGEYATVFLYFLGIPARNS